VLGVKNTDVHYGWISIIIHWVMGVLLLGLSVLGVYMVRLPISLSKLRLYGYHKEFGMLVLFLVIIRLIWRLINVLPHLPDDIPQWQEFAAHAMHRVFYLFMFAMPVTGWLITSAAGLPMSVFGLMVMPDLIAANKSVIPMFIFIHKWAGYVLICAILGHTGAALHHHLVKKDGVLRRMLP